MPSADELRSLLAAAVAEIAGGSTASWRSKIGQVMTLPNAAQACSPWAVSPMCGTGDYSTISAVVERVRYAHPFVSI